MCLLWVRFRCLLDIYYNLAGGNGGLELKREVGSHPFRSRDGHLGHGCDSAPLTDGQRSGMKTGKRVVQEKPRQEGV